MRPIPVLLVAFVAALSAMPLSAAAAGRDVVAVAAQDDGVRDPEAGGADPEAGSADPEVVGGAAAAAAGAGARARAGCRCTAPPRRHLRRCRLTAAP